MVQERLLALYQTTPEFTIPAIVWLGRLSLFRVVFIFHGETRYQKVAISMSYHPRLADHSFPLVAGRASKHYY